MISASCSFRTPAPVLPSSWAAAQTAVERLVRGLGWRRSRLGMAVSAVMRDEATMLAADARRRGRGGYERARRGWMARWRAFERRPSCAPLATYEGARLWHACARGGKRMTSPAASYAAHRRPYALAIVTFVVAAPPSRFACRVVDVGDVVVPYVVEIIFGLRLLGLVLARVADVEPGAHPVVVVLTVCAPVSAVVAVSSSSCRGEQVLNACSAAASSSCFSGVSSSSSLM